MTGIRSWWWDAVDVQNKITHENCIEILILKNIARRKFGYFFPTLTRSISFVRFWFPFEYHASCMCIRESWKKKKKEEAKSRIDAKRERKRIWCIMYTYNICFEENVIFQFSFVNSFTFITTLDNVFSYARNESSLATILWLMRIFYSIFPAERH